MLDFYPHEEKVNFADDGVLEVVLALVVLEFDVQAVLDADLHFDAVVDVGVGGEGVDDNFLLSNNVLTGRNKKSQDQNGSHR